MEVVTKKAKEKRRDLVADYEGLAGTPDFSFQNSEEEIFIRELKTKEKANPTRFIAEDKFPKRDGMIVVYKPYGAQGKGFYYVPGKNKWDKKENDMETLRDSYHVGSHNRDELISRGQHAYGSKKDNATCPCPECEGGSRLMLYQCRNCKGTGRVNAELKDGADSLKETDTSKNPGEEGESHTGPFFEPGDATGRQDDSDIVAKLNDNEDSLASRWEALSNAEVIKILYRAGFVDSDVKTYKIRGWDQLPKWAQDNLKTLLVKSNSKLNDGGKCATCEGAGKAGGKICRECDGTGFELSS